MLFRSYRLLSSKRRALSNHPNQLITLTLYRLRQSANQTRRQFARNTGREPVDQFPNKKSRPVPVQFASGRADFLLKVLLLYCECADVLEFRRQRYYFAVLQLAENHTAVEESLIAREALSPLLGEVKYRDHAVEIKTAGLVRSLIKRLRDRKSTRLNSSHVSESRMPSSA